MYAKLPRLLSAVALAALASSAIAQNPLHVILPDGRSAGTGQGSWLRHSAQLSEIQGALFDDQGQVLFGIDARMLAASQYHGVVSGRLLAVATLNPTVPVKPFVEVRVTGQYVMNGADAIVRAYLVVDSPLAVMPAMVIGMLDATLLAQDTGDLELDSSSKLGEGRPAGGEPRGRGVIVCPWNGQADFSFTKLPGGHAIGFGPAGAIGPQPVNGEAGMYAVAAAALERRTLEVEQLFGGKTFGKQELDKRLKLARAAEAREIRARLRSARDPQERDEILLRIRAIQLGAAQAFAPQDAGAVGTQIIGHFRATWTMQHP